MIILEMIKKITIFLLGNDVNLITTLLLLQFMDIITGFMYGKKTRTHKSSIFVEGVFKKITCILAIMLSKIIDNYFGMNGKVFILAYNYFIFYEIYSNIENFNKLDVKFFDKIKNIVNINKKNKGL